MTPETFWTVGLVSLIVSLVLSYFVIRLAVTHALRSHSVWSSSGGPERALERNAERQALRQAELDAYRQRQQSES